MINQMRHPFYSTSWQNAVDLSLPALKKQWLTHTGSLTRRLAQLGPFTVTPMSQWHTQLTVDQANFLGLTLQSGCLIREVTLCVNSIPYVYARSVLPDSSLAGDNQQLADMKERPLGSELFRFPQAQRQKLEACWISGSQLPVALNLDEPRLLARRSLFIKHQQPLLVAECFLPTLWQHLTTH